MELKILNMILVMGFALVCGMSVEQENYPRAFATGLFAAFNALCLFVEFGV